MLGKASPQPPGEVDSKDLFFNKQHRVRKILWKETKWKDKTNPCSAHEPVLKKTEFYLQALIMTGEARPYSTPWHKSFNPKSFSEVMAKS